MRMSCCGGPVRHGPIGEHVTPGTHSACHRMVAGAVIDDPTCYFFAVAGNVSTVTLPMRPVNTSRFL